MALSLTCRRLLYRKNTSHLQFQRTKYIVLLPEVSPNRGEPNPLLQLKPVPEFSCVTPEKCYYGLNDGALDFISKVWKLEEEIKGKRKKISTVDELLQSYLHPVELLYRPLDNLMGMIRLLVAARDSFFTLDQSYTITRRAASARNDRFRSPLLYYTCKNILKNAKPEDLTEEKESLIKKYILESKLNGMGLDQNDYASLLSMEPMLSEKLQTYHYRTSRTSEAFKYQISDQSVMKDFPETHLEFMCDGKDPRRGPWTVTLNPFIVQSVLEYCPDSLLRRNVWHASVTRETSDTELRTSKLVEEIRYFKRRRAEYLGYENYADMSMETKMAGSVKNVISVLDVMLENAKPAQAREIESLNKFALQSGFHKTLDIWDLHYWKRQQQIKVHNVNEASLSDYFPLDTVLCGLFSFLNDVFGVEIQECSVRETWDPHVRYFDVYVPNSTRPVGGFYFDPYERRGKVSSCALTVRARSEVGSLQLPIAGLLFNFPRPSLGKPSLLTFSDVQDLFGCFGDMLQIVLTRSSYCDLSGQSNVEWDAVAVCSEFMKHWVYTQPVLERISGHYVTGDKLPSQVVGNLSKIRRHMAGYWLCEEVYFSRFDLEMHTTKTFWRDIMKKMWPRHFVFPLEKDNDHPLVFSNTIQQGATYYCRLWSQMLAADVFSSFEEAGLENSDELSVVGKRFRDTYLSLGGTVHSSEVFRRFRGRDPSPDALLCWLGLQKPQKVPQAQ